VDVRIGITQTVREVELDMDDDKRDSLKKDVAAAMASGDSVLWLTDKKGRTVGVAAAKIAYIEIGSVSEDRKVGFAR
jgi:mannose/fructose-specific phosphotransferase system component IIA